jgi:hypothetical protein
MALKDRFAKPVDREKMKKLANKYGGSETDVWAISSGHGFVRFDGNTVVLRRTMLGRINVGKGEKRIPVRQITAIQIKPASPLEGFIQFSIGGGNEVKSRFGRQSWDARSDENSMPFALMEQAQFEALRDAIEASLAAPTASTEAPAAVAPDALDQLRKLAELRDAGVLTEHEFTEKKAVLMQRL